VWGISYTCEINYFGKWANMGGSHRFRTQLYVTVLTKITGMFLRKRKLFSEWKV
jgi:hypothetical protein